MKSPSWATRQCLARRVEKALEAQVRAAHTSSTPTAASTASNSSSSSSTIFRTAKAPTHHHHHRSTPSTRSPFTHSAARPQQRRQAGDEPGFASILDNPPELVRAGSSRRHGPGLIVLAIIPLTAFALGTWQVRRLAWKTDLLARCEDRLVRAPLPLPPRVDPDAVPDFDYRRVVARGRLRHADEMLVGPRMRDGEDGYLVITPLDRPGDGGDGSDTATDPSATVLVNRGWISKKMRDRRARAPEACPDGEVLVEGLLRQPWKKNMFTPDNRPDINEFYFPDVKQMAELTGSQPIWIEQTMDPELMEAIDLQNKGVPIGRPAEVNLRNNHAQYIFTWYALAAATSIMFYMVVKKPPSSLTRRVRQNKEWS